MRSLILERVARGLLPVTTIFALYLLLRGHNAPGGGFIAGLVTAGALILQSLAFGVHSTRTHLARLLRSAPWVGIAVATIAGMIPVFAGQPFLTHHHQYVNFAGGKLFLSTTLLFDIGVYITVVGVAAIIANLFAEGME